MATASSTSVRETFKGGSQRNVWVPEGTLNNPAS
jgi:hypothetical protein